ncbi:MAG: hypothetical protein M1839_003602 [Geoglossum umbratile]|nr:MAG: hypothetical protein M1839_003602 [Geoglossum umbratile]
MKQVLNAGKVLVGTHKLIDPPRLARIYISPRKRAQVTFELLFDSAEHKQALREAGKVLITDRLAEWGYGLYEGLLPGEIRALRKKHGLDLQKPWSIWRDGCEEGEAPEQVAQRLDSLIAEIRTLQSPNMHGGQPADVLLVAHGHLLRAFVKRWLNLSMEFPLAMMLEPGGIGVLR